MTSDERLQIYDNWVDTLQELKEINELLPYNNDRQIAINNLEKQEGIICRWWRVG